MTVTKSVRADAVLIRILLAEMRSVSAPPNNMSSARGMATAIRMVPTATADPVNCNTTHGSATR